MIRLESFCIFSTRLFVLQCVIVKWAKVRALAGLSLRPYTTALRMQIIRAFPPLLSVPLTHPKVYVGLAA